MRAQSRALTCSHPMRGPHRRSRHSRAGPSPDHQLAPCASGEGPLPVADPSATSVQMLGSHSSTAAEAGSEARQAEATSRELGESATVKSSWLWP